MNSNSRPRGTRSAATRSRVLDAALRLFNERGTGPVSTNHIAEAAGLSPGNLYYHFQDKKQIIRELHARYAAGYEGCWRDVGDGPANLARLHHNLAEGARLAWTYRFLEREILALLRADPELRADYRRVYRRRRQEWSAFGQLLVEQGMLRAPRDPLRVSDLTLAIWLIAQSWPAFVDATGADGEGDADGAGDGGGGGDGDGDGEVGSGGASGPAEMARAADLVLAVLDPYLTARGRRALSEVDGGAS